MWTLQEQVLARECQTYFGRRNISMASLQSNQRAAFLQFLHDEDGRFENGIRHRIHKFRQLYDASPLAADQMALKPLIEYNAKKLLELSFLLEAKLPIDKIYGIYGILTAYCNLPLSTPDYNKTAEDIFEETATAWITTRRDLGILKLATRRDMVDKLPSWVPAWHQQHPKINRNSGRRVLEDSCKYELSHFNWNYSCDAVSGISPDPPRGTEHPASVSCVVSPGRLRVLHARFAGRVTQTIGPNATEEHKWYQLSIESLHVHLEWCRSFSGIVLRSPITGEEALFEMFRSVLRPGVEPFRFDDGQSLEVMFKSFKSWFDFLSRLNAAPGARIRNSLEAADHHHDRELAARLYYDICAAKREDEAADLLKNVYGGKVQGREILTEVARNIRSTENSLRSMRNHSLCVLDNDSMIAITDYWCQEGDEVFVFPGTDSPFVLRRVHHENCYRLVGAALVDRLFRVGYQKWRSEGPDLQDIVLI